MKDNMKQNVSKLPKKSRKMSHAILIMAHKDYPQLRHLVEYFSHDCYVFIHIDRKGDITKEQTDELKKMGNVTRVYKRYAVHWGGTSILKCELFLIKCAMEESDADYIHIISGEDYPIKPLETFLNTFDNAKDVSFLSYVHLPHPKWQNNSYKRFEHFYPFDLYHDRNKSKQKAEQWVNFQKKWHIHRTIPHYFEHLYGGSQWFSITREAAQVVIKYTRRHPAFYRRMRFTFAPEESYIQTVLLNLMPVEKVLNDNLRFIRWKNENGNAPANLGTEHFHLLAASKSLFARKFSYPLCRQLVEKIDTYLLPKTPCDICETGVWIYKGFAQYPFYDRVENTIYEYIKLTGIETVIDVGCGCGHYVAALRRLGIDACGYDANPYTEELSKQLLPWGDEPCHTYDFSNELEGYDTFDLAICLDVLPYIPITKRKQFISNLIKLSKKAILISCGDNKEYDFQELTQSLTENHYTLNKFAYEYIKEQTKNRQEYFLFEL